MTRSRKSCNASNIKLYTLAYFVRCHLMVAEESKISDNLNIHFADADCAFLHKLYPSFLGIPPHKITFSQAIHVLRFLGINALGKTWWTKHSYRFLCQAQTPQWAIRPLNIRHPRFVFPVLFGAGR